MLGSVLSRASRSISACSARSVSELWSVKSARAVERDITLLIICYHHHIMILACLVVISGVDRSLTVLHGRYSQEPFPVLSGRESGGLLLLLLLLLLGARGHQPRRGRGRRGVMKDDEGDEVQHHEERSEGEELRLAPPHSPWVTACCGPEYLIN